MKKIEIIKGGSNNKYELSIIREENQFECLAIKQTLQEDMKLILKMMFAKKLLGIN